MNKKIFVPLVAVVAVAVSAGIFSMDYMNTNYEPFDDPKYTGNISTMTSENVRPVYDGEKSYSSVSGLYPNYSFAELVDSSVAIVTGTIKEVNYEEVPFNGGDHTVRTIYTVAPHSVLKGDVPNRIEVAVAGGETEDYFTEYDDMFVFTEHDQVLLFLGKEDPKLAGFEWTPNTPDGVYLVTNGGPDRGEVHRYGEDTTVPLPATHPKTTI